MARDRAARPQATPLRLFVAIEIPLEVRELVATAVAPWRERFPRGRWVPLENWHVTVKFLGATWSRLVEWVTASVGEVARTSAPFGSAVEGLGAFPSAERARVLWAGLADPPGGMGAIAGRLDEVLAREFAPEKRGFTAHLTAARFEPPVPLGQELAATAVRSEPFEIDRLVLFRSHLRRPAPVYEPLESFPLGGGPLDGR